MKSLRGLAVHTALLALAMALALVFWLRDETPEARAREMVEVWGGSPPQVERIEWEGEKRRVSLDASQDGHGRFFIGTADEEVAQARPPTPEDAVDGGPVPSEPVTERHHRTTRFISVREGERLAERLAPLRAFRALGQLDPARDEEFGFTEPQGTLRITIAGQVRNLLIGAAAPGDTDFYARQPDTGTVYAVPADVVRTLMGANSRLAEREPHGWEPDEVNRVVASTDETKRELVRIGSNVDDWASAGTSEQKDETAGNWINKLRLLRVTAYVEKPESPQRVVLVEYFDGQRKVGFLELVRVAGDQDRPDYLVATERTRWYGTIFRSTGEQLEQDLGSVLR